MAFKADRRTRPRSRRPSGGGSGHRARGAPRADRGRPRGHPLVNRLTKEKAGRCTTGSHALGAEAKVEPLVTHNWPKPYDELTNPLSINLTAFNTFVLICSSVTMVLALSAIQQGKRRVETSSSADGRHRQHLPQHPGL